MRVFYRLFKYLYIVIFFYVTPWIVITVPFILETGQNVKIQEQVVLKEKETIGGKIDPNQTKAFQELQACYQNDADPDSATVESKCDSEKLASIYEKAGLKGGVGFDGKPIPDDLLPPGAK